MRARLLRAGPPGTVEAMRPLRVLIHLFVALAVLTAASAQAWAAGTMPAGPRPDHHGAAAGQDHARGTHEDAAPASHGHGVGQGTPAGDRPVHKREACQTVCCFTPAQQPARAGEASAVQFSITVRYADAAWPLSGRVCAPDPGVPRRAA